MTLEEKLKMYREKQRFVENISGVFQVAPGCPSVDGVSYEVYTKDYGDGYVDTREWVIVHYTGGGWAPGLVSGNSHAAIFVVIGGMLNGGCYGKVRAFQNQAADGYEKVDL
jgi:hypothetical protein